MINSWLVSTFWIWIPLVFGSPSHAIYLSVTDGEVTEEALHFKVKVFSNDLKDALKNHDPSAYQPAGLSQFFLQNEPLAKRYFEEHFQLWNGEQPLELQLESFTIEGDAHFISFRSVVPNNFKELTVKASFFMELFPTQINVVKMKKGAQLKYLRFNNPAAPQTLSFQN